MEEKQKKQKKGIGRWGWATIVLAIVCIALLIALIVVAVKKEKETVTEQVKSPPCTGDSVIDTSESPDPGPFHDLTVKELKALQNYIYGVSELNLLKPDKATLNSSYIYLSDLYIPKKEDVLKYLDKNGSKPPRQGRVIIFRGDKTPPVVEEYIVGPLPNPNSHKLLEWPSGKTSIPYEYRPESATEVSGIDKYIFSVIDQKIGHVLKESYEATFTNCGNKCLTFYTCPLASGVLKVQNRRTWIMAMQTAEYYSLHPVDFFVLLNLDGTDPSKYSIVKIMYAGNYYSTLEELSQGYNATTIKKSKVPFPKMNKQTFTTSYRRGNPVPKKPQRPPRLFEPDGKRYSIRHRHIEYLQWQFDFRLSSLRGLQLYDIRFNGERIAYEIGLQEIAVFYSGHNPAQRSADYVDSGSLIGTRSLALVPGADCPETASFVDSNYLSETSEEPQTMKRAICIFEQNSGVPLRRHLSYSTGEGAFYMGMLDSALTLRTIMTVVNYDYIVDFTFHQSGALAVKTISNGYILSTVYTSDEDKHGFKIHDNIIGNIHYHAFNFKADLDVLGTQNRYETLDISLEEVDNSVSAGYPNATYWQTKFDRKLKSTEQEAAYKFNFDSPKYHIIHNNANRTRHGTPRAYRIHLAGIGKQMLPEDSGNEIALAWSRYQLAVTKLKDLERDSTSIYALYDTLNPTVNFSSYIADNDNIVDQDLVMWISMGIHHIPHTEDLPVTQTVGSHLDFFLVPYNYFEECPSMASRDAIREELKNPDKPAEGVNIIRYTETSTKVNCIPTTPDYDAQVKDDPDLAIQSKNEGGGLY